MKGGCLCGAVRYETEATPRHQGFCHCRDCQKATGAGHCCYMIFDRNDVEITGKTKSFSVISESGVPALRYFCESCGSQMFGMGPPEDPRLTVYAGTLDDPELFKPTESIFVRSRRHWDHNRLDLPEYQLLPG